MRDGGAAIAANVSVLVVDDQATFRQAMVAVVDATDGFEIVGQAASGETALRACAELQPDLVLMDVNLPGIDGVEATRRLRGLPSPPVVLLLSTYDADTADGFISDCGAAAYVLKSEFGPDRLLSAWAAANR
jgi:DNA-binding NarL/FixJ family response regulator